MKNSIITICFLSLLSCKSQTEKKLHEVYSFPNELKEVSGMMYDSNSELLFVLEDSGNKNILFGLDTNGKVSSQILIKDVHNHDWEALTKDEKGDFYIGDFGNNKNQRTDLSIYKIANADLQKKEAVVQQTTSFFYPEQQKFPPKNTELFFDAESFIVYKDYFYVFTKNRSKGFDGTFYVYKIPNKPGKFEAKRIATLKSCDHYRDCAITDAALSPDGKTIALLSSSRVWLITDFENDLFNEKNIQMYDLNHTSQKESIVFRDEQTLWISDEVKKKEGGKLYRITLTDLKAKP